MGCDIHYVFQAKTGDDWLDVASTYEGTRHYYLFGALAGVRGWDTTPIDEPRGLPSDFPMVGDRHPMPDELMTPLEIEWREDGEEGRWMGDHSYSWLSGGELLASDYAKDDDLRYFFGEVGRLKDLHGEIRFVFGFDN